MGAWGGRAGRVGGLVGEWMDGCSDGRMMDGQVNHVKNDKSADRKCVQTSVFFTQSLKDLFKHLMRRVCAEHYDIAVLADR